MSEQKKILNDIKIINKMIPKFGSITTSKTKIKNNMHSTLSLMFNLLFIIHKKRKACLINSFTQVINKKIIAAFEELIDSLDGSLAFEWVHFIKDDINDYQLIFYNTNLLSQKVVRAALNAYKPDSKDYCSCCCTSCTGGIKYANKLKNILDYPCSVEKVNYKDCKYYEVRLFVKYKKKRFVPFFYDCATKPNMTLLKKKYAKLNPILKCMDNAELEICVEYME